MIGIKWLRLAGIIGLCALLQGCWDVKDIDNRLLVGVLGIEKANDQEDSHLIRLWVRFPIPKSSQSTSGGLDKDFFTLEQEGDTVVEAWDHLRLKMPKAVDMSQTRAIFFDVRLAEQGFFPYLEFTIRDRTLPLSTLFALTSEDMKSIFTRPNPTGELSGIYTKLFFERYAGGTSQKNRTPLWRLFSRYYNPLQNNLIPVVEADNQGLFQLKSNAFFYGDRMVGKIAPEETLIYEMITGNISPFEIETTKGAGVKILQCFTKIHSSLVRGKPVIRIRADLTMTLTDSARKYQMEHSDIEDSINQLLEERASKLFRTVQEKKSDIFGFGNQYRAKLAPEHYKDWPEMFQQATIEMEFHSKLRNTGLQLLEPKNL